MQARIVFLPVAALVTLVACGGPLKYAPPPSAKAPEADVRIVADVAKDLGQTKVTLRVEHLAPPDRLAASGAHFVLWYRKNGDAPWQRVGALKYDDGARRGALEEVTVPETAFELELTDERDVSPASPSPDVITSQQVNP